MTVRYFDDRVEAYLDANLQPTTEELAVFIRVLTATDEGMLSQLLKVEPPTPGAPT